MAIRITAAQRRRVRNYRKRAAMRRPVYKRRQYRSALAKKYMYKQIVLNPTSLGPVTLIGGAGDLLAAHSFNLSQAGGNVGPFTSLYDQYCIKKIVWKLIPRFNMSEPNTTTGGITPNIVTCLDFDDAIPPANYGDILQRQNAKIHRGNGVITRVFKPSANFVVDATTGALAPKMSPWLDVTNITVPHFGVKFAIQNTCPTGLDLDYDVVCNYYLAFKQVR